MMQGMVYLTCDLSATKHGEVVSCEIEAIIAHILVVSAHHRQLKVACMFESAVKNGTSVSIMIQIMRSAAEWEPALIWGSQGEWVPPEQQARGGG